MRGAVNDEFSFIIKLINNYKSNKEFFFLNFKRF